MARDQSDPTPIESRDELVAWFAQGEKPAAEFRIGTEHEKFGFYEHDLAPVPYEGSRGIGALLRGLAARIGWEPIMDRDALIETLQTGRAVYFSRSRGTRWLKGETSGHVQDVREVRLDCDGDTVLLLVDQTGGACHTGDRTCFDRVGVEVAP